MSATARMFDGFYVYLRTLGINESLRLRFYRFKRPEGRLHPENTNNYQDASEGDVDFVQPILRYRHRGEFADDYGFCRIFGCWTLAGILIWLGVDFLWGEAASRIGRCCFRSPVSHSGVLRRLDWLSSVGLAQVSE